MSSCLNKAIEIEEDYVYVMCMFCKCVRFNLCFHSTIAQYQKLVGLLCEVTRFACLFVAPQPLQFVLDSKKSPSIGEEEIFIGQVA